MLLHEDIPSLDAPILFSKPQKKGFSLKAKNFSKIIFPKKDVQRRSKGLSPRNSESETLSKSNVTLEMIILFFLNKFLVALYISRQKVK